MSSQPNSYEAFGYNLFPITEPSLLWRLIDAFERSFAYVLLAVGLPILVVVCLIIVLLSRRSPLIAHRRVGKAGQEIWIYKVRTMWSRESRKGSRFTLVEYLHGDVTPECKCRFDPRI